MQQHPKYKDVFITEDGRVFRELTPSVDSGGYAQIRNGKIRQRRHVLVCEAFHGPRPPGQVVRHLDGDESNDDPDNLAWGPQAQNCQDTVEHGNSTKGTKNAQAILTEEQVLDIFNRRKAGESGREVARDYGVNESTVCDIFKGRTWAWLTKQI